MGLAVTSNWMELVAIANWMELKHYFTAASQIHQQMGPMNRWMNCPRPPLGAVERLFSYPAMNRWMNCPRPPLGAIERLFSHPPMNRWMNCPRPPLGAVERLSHPPMNRWMNCPRPPLGAVERLFGHPDMRTRKEGKKKLYYVELLCRNVLLCYIIIPKDMGTAPIPMTLPRQNI